MSRCPRPHVSLAHRAMLGALVGAALAFAPSAALAACPADPPLSVSTATTEASPGQRLEFISHAMEVGARRSTAWAASWGTVYGVASTTLFTIASGRSGRLSQ